MNIYGLAPINGACHWYRIREPLRALAARGHMTEFGELFDDSIVNRNDTILTHMLHDPMASQAWEWLAEAGQHRLIYDIDDSIWQWPEGSDQRNYWTAERIGRAEQNMHRAHLITTPSAVLRDSIVFRCNIDPTKIVVLPNYVPEWVTQLKRTIPEHFTLGYQGAPQQLHQADIDTIQTELFMFLDRCPDARLLFFGQPGTLQGAGPFADRIEFIPWTPDVPAYYRSLYRMTIGMAPLVRSPYPDSKSSVRAVEYHALGIPAVYSNVPAYRGWIDHRQTGYLTTDIREWRKHFIKLYRNPELVTIISDRARRLGREWTIERNAWKWEQAYEGSGPGA